MLKLYYTNKRKKKKMSYYSDFALTASKWDTIQEDIADAYSYLDEEDKQEEDSELALLDTLDIDELSDKELLTLDWNN
jgi:hypothetical protein